MRLSSLSLANGYVARPQFTGSTTLCEVSHKTFLFWFFEIFYSQNNTPLIPAKIYCCANNNKLADSIIHGYLNQILTRYACYLIAQNRKLKGMEKTMSQCFLLHHSQDPSRM